MKPTIQTLAERLHPKRLNALAAYLLRDEAIGGKFILIALALALLAANTPLQGSYESFWHTKLSLGLGDWALTMDLRHWVSDGLMTFFFLVVGLELKRELVRGELKEFKKAALPFVAALGGMALPALIYTAFNYGQDTLRGWAIPTATDIALAIGLLALLGKRIPSSVRLFILTLAIVDDIAAVIIIALFYSSGVSVLALMVGTLIAILIYTLGRSGRLGLLLFGVLGAGLWLAFYAAGIHPSISGALLGFIAPLARKDPALPSLAERTEHAIIPVSALFVVPLFAFANTGLHLADVSIAGEAVTRLAAGIVFGLVVGKALGISGAVWIAVRFGWARLPSHASWLHVIGVSLLAGIGFTVSIFVTELAFTDIRLIESAKASIFVASALSGVLGLLVLRRARPVHARPPELQPEP